MKRRDQSDFSYEVETLSRKTAEISEATLKHENLHKKPKNHYPIWNHHQGRPANVPFELCPKPRKKCLLRAVASGELFCMADEPCWKRGGFS